MQVTNVPSSQRAGNLSNNQRGTADLKILKWVKTDSIPWGLSRLVHDDTRHEFLM